MELRYELMKRRAELLWALLALVSVPFYSVCRDTMEVKDGVISVYQTTWWCKKTKVKSLKVSCFRGTRTKSRGTKGGTYSIEVWDIKGQLFWAQLYQGFDGLDRACRDAAALRRAIRTGSAFSTTCCTSAGLVILLVFISLFMWFYKRSWRLERERQEREERQEVAKDRNVTVPQRRKIQIKTQGKKFVVRARMLRCF